MHRSSAQRTNCGTGWEVEAHVARASLLSLFCREEPVDGGGSEPYTLHSYQSTSTPFIAYDTSKKPAGRSTREQTEPEIGTNQSEIQAQFRRMTGRAYPRSNLTEQNIQMGERFC